jgi:hypothetical protein
MTTRFAAIFARTAALLTGAVLLQNAWGDSLFGLSKIYTTYSSPQAVAVGDINGDGRNDVLLTTYFRFDPENDYRLFVFRQDEAGELIAPTKYATRATYFNSPGSVAVGDLNNDGRADVVVAICGLGLEIFYQGDNGLVTPSVFIETPHSCLVRIGHLNGDNLLDVAAIGWQADAVAVLSQGADGKLSAPQTYLGFHGGWDDLKLGDVNGDGRTDIVVMSGQYYYYPNLSVLTQNADGTFTTTFYDLGIGELTSGVSIADVNADGRKDVIVTFGGGTWTPPKIAVFHQDTTGTLSAPVLFASAEYPGPIETADFDHDGRDDIVVGHSDVGRIGVYPGNVDGAMVEGLYEIPYATWTLSHGLAVGDINVDGAPDVVVANSNGYLVVQLNQFPVNKPAVADAGPDSTVRQGSTVTLDGTRSYDPDGQIVAYEWTQVSGIPVALATTGIPGVATFTAPMLSAGASPLLEFELRVTPDLGAKKSDRVVITPNQPPVANAGSDQTVVQGSVVTLDGRTSTDPNNAIVDYRWRQLSGPAVTLQASANPGVVSFTAQRLRGLQSADLVFELVVTDATGDSATDQVVVHVVK